MQKKIQIKMVIGASGGSKIISAMAKPTVRYLFFNETIKEAIDAPTLHNQFTPLKTQYERLVPEVGIVCPPHLGFAVDGHRVQGGHS